MRVCGTTEGNCVYGAVLTGVYVFVRVPAFVHPPQVKTGEGGGALVPFARIR